MMRGALLMALALAAGSLSAAATQGTVATSFGIGYDGNPRELIDADHVRADRYLRLGGDVSLRGSGPGRSGWETRLRWAAERYYREARETRHLAGGELRWHWSGATRGGEAYYRGQLRTHPVAAERRTVRHEFGLRGHVRGVHRATLRATLRWLYRARDVSAADTGDDPGRREGVATGLEGHVGLRRGWRLIVRGEVTWIGYDRAAVELGPGGVGVTSDEDQRDLAYYGGIGFARSGMPLLQALAGWQRVTSNSHGVGVRRWRFDLLAGLQVTPRLQLLMTAQWEPGEVRDDERALFDPAIDPDDPEFGARHGVTVRLIHALGRDWDVELQGAWYRSQSRLLWEEYEKPRALLSLRHRAAL